MGYGKVCRDSSLPKGVETLIIRVVVIFYKQFKFLKYNFEWVKRSQQHKYKKMFVPKTTGQKPNNNNERCIL